MVAWIQRSSPRERTAARCPEEDLPAEGTRECFTIVRIGTNNVKEEFADGPQAPGKKTCVTGYQEGKILLKADNDLCVRTTANFLPDKVHRNSQHNNHQSWPRIIWLEDQKVDTDGCCKNNIESRNNGISHCFIRPFCRRLFFSQNKYSDNR